MTKSAAIVLGVFLGPLVSGYCGFAFSAVAGAVLIHVFEPHATIPLMMGCSIISQIVTMLVLRRSVQFGANPILLVGGLFGVALAIIAMGYFSGQMLRAFRRLSCGLCDLLARQDTSRTIVIFGALVSGRRRHVGRRGWRADGYAGCSAFDLVRDAGLLEGATARNRAAVHHRTADLYADSICAKSNWSSR